MLPDEPSSAPAAPPPRGLFEVVDALRLMTLGLGLVVLYYLLQDLADRLIGSFYGAVLVSCVVALIAIPWRMARVAGQGARSTFRLLPVPASQLLWLTLLALALVLPVEFLGGLTARLIPVPEAFEKLRAELVPRSALEWVLAVIALCVAVPLGEETVFRGLIQQAARGPLGGGLAALLCGLLFAGLHFQPWFLGGLVLLGIALGLTLEITGSLLASLWVHAIYNAVVVVALAVDPRGQGKPLTDGHRGLLLLVVSVAVATLAWLRLRRCHPWEDDAGEDPDGDTQAHDAW
jgi:membrane protease YdiL (CAAX protease family)